MCNSVSMFKILGEEIGGEHDKEKIDLPNKCSLVLWPSITGSKWFYKTINAVGQSVIGCDTTRINAFDRAMEHLAEFIN